MSRAHQDPRELPCIICKKGLEHILKRELERLGCNQPGDGVVCHTHGNYGSTVFDEIDGHYLEFNICDECLTKAREQGLIALGIRPLPLRVWNEGLEDSLLDEALGRVHWEEGQADIYEAMGVDAKDFVVVGSVFPEDVGKPPQRRTPSIDKETRQWILEGPFTDEKRKSLEDSERAKRRRLGILEE